jgi:WD40 repeat protein/energy-coupling factor transporter ATP-binding protein EcfA2
MADFKEFNDISFELERRPMFNPFPGLRPFTIQESHLFFGREGQSEEVLYKLSQNKFVAVLGASGSGKSSLMYCGLLPILYGGFITNAGSRWRIITTRPGTNPIDNLATALAKSESQTEEGESFDFLLNVNKTVLRSSSLGLVEAVRQLKTPQYENMLIMVDQFEELFRFKRMHSEYSVNETEAFVKLLVEAQAQSTIPIYIILTMRSDFIGDCSNFQDLTSLINESHFLIPQMTRDDFRDAIIGPVAVGGGEIDPNLVQQLLNDVGDNPDQLPILQHAMMRTWDFWIRNTKGNRPISFADYEAIGKMERALSDHANEAFDELSLEGKRICKSMFKSLTERGGDNRGIRRPTAVTEVADICRADLEEVFSVVEKFRKEGRSFVTPPFEVDLQENSIIDISHESLMRIWDKLKLWVDEEASAVQMYTRLCEAAELYQQGKTGLWRPPDLQLALNWRDKQEPTLTWAKRYNTAFERAMVYLSTSEREFLIEEENKIRLQKRQLRRSKVFALVLGTAAILSLGFMLYSVVLRQEAERAKITAEEQTEEAQKQKEIAESASSRAEQQRALAEKNANDALEQKNEADRQKSLAEQSAEEAKRQEEIALQKSKEAIEQSELAEKNAKEANQQREAAEAAKNEAFTRRMLSIASSMAVKSQSIEGDSDVKALLAYQSFLFNKDFGGSIFHPDVYNGVYDAMKMTIGDRFNVYKGHDGSVQSLEFGDDSNTLYTYGTDGRILEWNLEDESGGKKEIYKAECGIRLLSVNSEAKLLSLADEDNNVYVFDLKDSTVVSKSLQGLRSPVQYLSFTNSVGSVEYAGKDTSVYKFEFQKDTILPYRSFSENFLKIKKCRSGALCLLYEDALIEVQQGDDRKRISFKELVKGEITSYQLSPKRKFLAVGDVKGDVYVWNLDKNQLEARLLGHKARVSGLDFSPEGEILATCSYDGSIQIWETNNLNEQPIIINDSDYWLTDVKFSPDGSKLVSSNVKNEIRILPAKIDYVVDKLCGTIQRNFTEEEWNTYVASDIPYQKTCENIE